jgi:hypothetical protein
MTPAQVLKPFGRSRIGGHLFPSERARLLDGRCPDCGASRLEERFNPTNEARVDCIAEIEVRCLCGFGATIRREPLGRFGPNRALAAAERGEV